MPQDNPKQQGSKMQEGQTSDTERKDGMGKPGEGAEVGGSDPDKHNAAGRGGQTPQAHRPAED